MCKEFLTESIQVVFSCSDAGCDLNLSAFLFGEGEKMHSMNDAISSENKRSTCGSVEYSRGGKKNFSDD
ncbi:MAG: TerD family protein, partial [Planctomycetaceae bacterium]|nr:TerD family protein [Planctomycetaceae bacterium]